MLTHFMNTTHLLVSDIKGYEIIIHRRVYLSSTCIPDPPNISACIPDPHVGVIQFRPQGGIRMNFRPPLQTPPTSLPSGFLLVLIGFVKTLRLLPKLLI